MLKKRIGLILVSVFIFCSSIKALDAAQLTVKEIVVGDVVVTMVQCNGSDFRLVDVSDMAQALRSGQKVCVDAKFRRRIENKIEIFGVENSLRTRSDITIGMFQLGDNLWLLGGAKVDEKTGGVVLEIEHIATRPKDEIIFEQRYKVLVKTRDIEGLLRLSGWLKSQSDILEEETLGNKDRYRSLINQSTRRAIRFRAENLGFSNSPESWHRLGLDTLTLLRDYPMAATYFSKCQKLDPTHIESRKRLESMGWVLHDGKWLSIAERDRAISGVRSSLIDAHKKDSTLIGKNLSLSQRRIIYTKLSRDETPTASTHLRDAVSQESDINLLRELLWFIANREVDTAMQDALTSALKSRHSIVRGDAAEILSLGEYPQRAAILGASVVSETNSLVRIRIINTILKLQGPDRIEALVLATGCMDRNTRKLVQESLTSITSESFETPSQWQDWFHSKK